MIRMKRRKRPKMGVRQPPADHVSCRGHLAFIRGCECVMANVPGASPCLGRTEAHHVRHKRHRDDLTVPMCVQHHTEVHKGHDTFEAKHKVDLFKIALTHWTASPHGKKWRREKELEAAE